MPTVKTLPVYVYRSNGTGDCTNGGVSAAHDTLYLVCAQGWRDTPSTDPRLLHLVEQSFPWRDQPYLSAEPTNPGPVAGKVGPMMGGNFVYTSDTRFPATYPIPLHDRYETQELYDQLSR